LLAGRKGNTRFARSSGRFAPCAVRFALPLALLAGRKGNTHFVGELCGRHYAHFFYSVFT
ncbi:MAG: hypothetical protein UC961_02565, partial [Emergencia sp.]|nr:hypothetical protein [Emergencia sp.]